MQPVHYFQRYSQQENVATNNTLLLFSRLYHHSPSQYNLLINDLFSDSGIEAGVIFTQQEKALNSIPDGSIFQESFKIVIETKLTDKFNLKQLVNHCNAFTDSGKNILLSLSPGSINTKNIEEHVNTFNKNNKQSIKYKHLTFKKIIASFRSVINEYDLDFNVIIDDYEDFCFSSGLIDDSEDYMRAVPCGLTLSENFKYNLYYASINRGFSSHGYIGLYANKCISGIGKISNIIEAELRNDRLYIIDASFNVTDSQKESIKGAIIEAKKERNWNISTGHRFFISDRIYETDYKKTSQLPLRGTKFFNLLELLELESLPDIDVIAKKLSELTW